MRMDDNRTKKNHIDPYLNLEVMTAKNIRIINRSYLRAGSPMVYEGNDVIFSLTRSVRL